MSPSIFRVGELRFHFFSREEDRLHVHVSAAGGEAKIWLEPRIEVARSNGLSQRQLRRAIELARQRQPEIRAAWEKHFRS